MLVGEKNNGWRPVREGGHSISCPYLSSQSIINKINGKYFYYSSCEFKMQLDRVTGITRACHQPTSRLRVTAARLRDPHVQERPGEPARCPAD